MKRIFQIIKIAILLIVFPFSSSFGQDKKNEQKINIIVNDGSDTKVIIDTVLNGDTGPDSLLLKDGSVVHLKHPHDKDSKHFFVTYSSDNKDGDAVTREMTVITSDSLDTKDDDGNVMYYRNDRDGHHRTRVITENDSDSNVDKTRFVIAKDGMVVTIEGTDEVRAKELAEEIKQKLGITGKEENKEPAKSKPAKKINK